jgi:DNA-binding XRE family transcriptional regulator
MVTEANTEQCPNRLRALRNEHPRKTQWQTAAAVGIGQTRYQRIETGRTPPTAEERRRLAEFFGVPVHKAFPRSPKRPTAQAA